MEQNVDEILESSTEKTNIIVTKKISCEMSETFESTAISKSFEHEEFKSSSSDVTKTENSQTITMQTEPIKHGPETEVVTDNANARVIQPSPLPAPTPPPPPPPPHRVQDSLTSSKTEPTTKLR